MNKTSIPKNKKAQKKKIILTSLAVGAAGILGYFGWQYIKKKKGKKNGDEPMVLPTLKNDTVKPKVVYKYITPKVQRDTVPKDTTPIFNYDTILTPTNPKGDFPLQLGSKGEKVRHFQEALMNKYGKQVLPKYGADGYFGGEMVTALRKLKLPTSINQTTYNVVTQGVAATNNSLATQLAEAATKNDFATAIALLKKIKTKTGYEQVSNEFKNLRIKGGVRQTLVNGMLNSFTKDEQKQAIRFQFIRMGLQYDGKKWSLSGLDGLPIMTTEATTVWAMLINLYKYLQKWF
jgi:peptidoglycan hydrolase-like protein with peptidoglycan-binding domain